MTTPVVIRRRMSQSIIGQGDTCLKRIEYDFFHDTPVVGNVSRLIGSAYHAGLAEGYAALMRGETVNVDDTVSAATDAFLKGVEWDDYVDKPVDEFSWTYQPKTYRAPHIELRPVEATQIVGQLVRYYWQTEARNTQVIAVEFRVNLPYPGAPAGWDRGGGIDLVTVDDAGYLLVDHKTSRKKWAKKKVSPTHPQAAWYIDEWRTYANTDQVKFEFDVMAINLDPETLLADPSLERWPAPRTQAQIDMTLERGRDLAVLIEKGGPFLPNPESFLCSPHYCDHWKICPYGSTLNL